MTCEKCGQKLEIGAFPFCPHAPAHLATIGDDIPGGQVIETLGHEPETFYSKKAIVAAAAARGLRPTDRWVPGDKHLSNWAAGVTAKTLDDARVLLTRGSKTTETIRCETAEFSVTEWKPCS